MDIFLALTEMQIMGLCIRSEASGEPLIGQLAVAYVVLNRVAAKTWFGRDIREVVLKPWQFSWFNPGLDRLAALEIAKNLDYSYILMGELAVARPDLDPTYGATHFYSTDISEPYWAKAMKSKVQIGKHRFYSGF